MSLLIHSSSERSGRSAGTREFFRESPQKCQLSNAALGAETVLGVAAVLLLELVLALWVELP